MKELHKLIQEITTKHQKIITENELRIIALQDIKKDLERCAMLLQQNAKTQEKITQALQRICDALPELGGKNDRMPKM